jgi:DNA mismatch repair protein MutS
VLHDTLLADRRNTFLVSVTPEEGGARGVAALDLSTGELTVQEVGEMTLAHELGRLEPSEVLLPRGDDDALLEALERIGRSPALTERDPWLFDSALTRDELARRYRVQSLDGFGFEDGDGLLVRAAGALIAYVHEIRPAGVAHLRPPRVLRPGASMVLDEMTRRNLELVEPLRAGEAGGTLLEVLDEPVTAMGARLLRQWVLRPLVDAPGIWARQESVAELAAEGELRRGLRSALRPVSDLERIAGKLGTGRVAPRDLAGLARSLGCLPIVRQVASRATSELLQRVGSELDLLEDVAELLASALADDVPATVQHGGVIRTGYNEELDDLRGVRDGAVDFIATLQVRERERTGIGSLKVGFNKVFGYYLEVTRSNLDRVPDDYVRKQTLANAERYFTPELKEWEQRVFGAEDRIGTLEAELFSSVRARVAREVARLQASAAGIATLDVLAALAEVAVARAYVRPEVHTGYDLRITAGRHPVVETRMPREEFIPNDLVLDDEGFLVVLTGPNMAGKSTVLRQVGLIQLLAQMGSFVPADAARIPLADRIFTRVGASDNLVRGQSTFMVEMHETAAILHGATRRSLVLLDEIGRGTSTYDGVSIAWAVTEHIHEAIGCKSVFATHYHELTQLGDLLPGVRNLNVSVREVGEDIVFLRRLEEGGADRSYGIQVARLAGVPDGVIARARELLVELEGTHSGGGEGLGRHGRLRPASEPPPDQLSFFQIPMDHPVVDTLKGLDVNRITPMEALALLDELIARARGGEPG